MMSALKQMKKLYSPHTYFADMYIHFAPLGPFVHDRGIAS